MRPDDISCSSACVIFAGKEIGDVRKPDRGQHNKIRDRICIREELSCWAVATPRSGIIGSKVSKELKMEQFSFRRLQGIKVFIYSFAIAAEAISVELAGALEHSHAQVS